MSDMNIRALLGRGHKLLGRIRVGSEAAQPPGSFSLLALRLERDLQRREGGHSIAIAAADDDAVGVEATMELAWCLAEELGHSVLVIDAAFESKALSIALAMGDRPGLAEHLEAAEADAPPLQAVVQATVHDRISILAHGDDAAVGRAVRADAIKRLLAAACARYDFVLVNCSLQEANSRSMAFTALVDATLLIAVEEQTTIEQVSRGQQILNDCGATRMALVLANRPRAPRPNGR